MLSQISHVSDLFMKNASHRSSCSGFSSRRWKYLTSLIFLSIFSGCTEQDNKTLSPISLTSSLFSSEEPSHIGLIIPLSGRNAPLGQRMKDAALLALNAPENLQDNSSTAPLKPKLDIFDSAAPGGAKKAAEDAVTAGDKIVIGPLLASDTAQAGDILQAASIPELAFTSDNEQARPHMLWVMGLTPKQQVERLVSMAASEKRTKFAAFLPDTALGHALAEALVGTCQEKGLDVPQIVFHDNNIASILEKMASLSHLSERQAAIAKNTPTTPSEKTDGAQSDLLSAPPLANSAENNEAPLPPPPFDALLLGDTGLNLAHVIEALKENQIDSLKIRIMGPASWKNFDTKLGDLKGAWYSASDDRIRLHYVHDYQNIYHQLPSPLTDFSYDSLSLARKLLEEKNLTLDSLTAPSGFDGVGGHFRLLENGQLDRSLAIYQILLGGGAQIILPASSQIKTP